MVLFLRLPLSSCVVTELVTSGVHLDEYFYLTNIGMMNFIAITVYCCSSQIIAN